MTDPILKIENLAVGFDDVPILENVSFELGRGESLSVIGPNGAGKTVFLRSLLGTVPYNGIVTWAPDARLGYVPQKIDADRHLPVTFRNLLAAKANVLRGERRMENGEWREKINEIVETVGLTEKILNTPVGHLSGGEFQRALIGFALLGKPNVLLLDEPTASIDVAGEEQVYELLHRLQDEYRFTIIVVSHDLSFVYRYATKVLCINRSGLCFGNPEEALTPDVLEQLYGPHKYYHHFHHPK
ncbi:MAG: metal ABC transporter ATP-binding protein [Patescibacteria group bacterium]|nr:metal ABC transporter ATP-binding protein [Patescibacteria group bacterium]